ncbi:MAG: hypothetical protein JOS17DRAFT_92542 [Linnemannia elongata]|nr:MAG: hypothetical protein JOS17DRAFT_92542 [Linnemannia elongata]
MVMVVTMMTITLTMILCRQAGPLSFGPQPDHPSLSFILPLSSFCGLRILWFINPTLTMSHPPFSFIQPCSLSLSHSSSSSSFPSAFPFSSSRTFSFFPSLLSSLPFFLPFTCSISSSFLTCTSILSSVSQFLFSPVFYSSPLSVSVSMSSPFSRTHSHI